MSARWLLRAELTALQLRELLKEANAAGNAMSTEIAQLKDSLHQARREDAGSCCLR